MECSAFTRVGLVELFEEAVRQARLYKEQKNKEKLVSGKKKIILINDLNEQQKQKNNKNNKNKKKTRQRKRRPKPKQLLIMEEVAVC